MNIKDKIREIGTYHSKGGTSGYLLTEKQFEKIFRLLGAFADEMIISSAKVDYIEFAPYDMRVAERRKLDVGDIYINQVKHTTCGWYIRSKNRHDCQTCKCGKLSVDGGSWRQIVTGDIENAEDHSVMYKYCTLKDRMLGKG